MTFESTETLSQMHVLIKDHLENEENPRTHEALHNLTTLAQCNQQGFQEAHRIVYHMVKDRDSSSITSPSGFLRNCCDKALQDIHDAKDETTGIWLDIKKGKGTG